MPSSQSLIRELREIGNTALRLAEQVESPEEDNTIRQRILHTLSEREKPTKGALLAVVCKHKYDSYFRQSLASLVREGTLEKTGNGYYFS